MNKIEKGIYNQEFSEKTPPEIKEASEALKEGVGSDWRVFEKIAGNSKLRKAFKVVALYVGLFYGQEGLTQSIEKIPEISWGAKQAQKLESQEQEKDNEFKPAVESLKQLIGNFIKDGVISDKNIPGWYFNDVGKYEIEYYDRGKDGKIDENNDRVSIKFEDNKGSKYVIGFSFGKFNHVAINFKTPLPSFKKMTAGEFKQNYGIIVRLEDSEILYVKELTLEEVEEVINDVKTTQTQESTNLNSGQ